jgi:hypothetical protein
MFVVSKSLDSPTLLILFFCQSAIFNSILGHRTSGTMGVALSKTRPFCKAQRAGRDYTSILNAAKRLK